MSATAVFRMHMFLERLIGAAVLDAATYEEVEADRRATPQAIAVVLLSSLAGGIGALGLRGATPAHLAFFSAVALMAWAAWALVIYQIGVRILPESHTRSDLGELLRTTGFASAPGLLRVLGIVPVMTVPIFALSTVWMLAAMIVAVRQALDYTGTRRAVTVCVLGWVLAIAFALVLGFFFGPGLF